MPVHLGFVPLNDCAPIVSAQEQMRACGVIEDPSLIDPDCIAKSFRADIFHQASRLIRR
jgi:hypothetical protein